MLERLLMTRRLPRWTAVLGGLFLGLSLSGCGGGEVASIWDTVYPAKGIVTYKGEPVADADIAFYPEDSTAPDTVRPRAKSSYDGTFEVWTYQRGDGIPAGTYKATVMHFEVDTAGGAVGAKPNDLPKKYARAATSNLIVEISPTENEIPSFDLK